MFLGKHARLLCVDGALFVIEAAPLCPEHARDVFVVEPGVLRLQLWSVPLRKAHERVHGARDLVLALFS